MRDNWCTVIERAVPPPSPDETGIRTSDSLRLQRGLRLDRRERIRRQWEGEDIDLDAATEVFIDRRLGLAPTPACSASPAAARATPASCCCSTCRPRPPTCWPTAAACSHSNMTPRAC